MHAASLDLDVTRRGLLAAGGAAAAALALRPLAALELPGAVAAAPDPLTRSAYAGLVGQRFAIDRAGGPALAARLVEVRDLRGAAAGDDRAFALRFHAAGGRRVEQAVHGLRHPALGRVELLLAPSGTGRRGQDYEAVVNRSRR